MLLLETQVWPLSLFRIWRIRLFIRLKCGYPKHMERNEEIIQRYLKSENVATIASDYGVNRKTIHKWLHTWGIPARNSKLAHTGRKRRDFTLNEIEWIIDQFTNQGRLLKAIAQDLSIWDGCVRRVLVQNGIRVKTFNPTKNQIDDMIRLYNQGASLGAFQETLGISRVGATRILREAGVEIRRRGKAVVYGVKDNQKRCGKCQKYKNFDQFQKININSTELQCYCRDCASTSSVLAKLKWKHGIDQGGYEKMRDAQKGLCAICNQPETRKRLGKNCRLVVDHDHENGRIRGLLCSMCNCGIGNLRDDPELLRKAANYIEYHRNQSTETQP